MVLETLLSAKSAHRHPLLLMMHAMVLSSIAIWIAHLAFPESASMLSIAFFTIALIPIMENLLKHEEKIEAKHPGFAASFLTRHSNILQAYAWIFIGLIVSYAFWYTVLPVGMKGEIFSAQESAFQSISETKSSLTGMFNASAACGKDSLCWFGVILSNNAMVLFLAIVLSLLFGAGAIFLIAWNASIIGVVIGKDVISLAANYTQFGFFNGILAFSNGMYNALGLLPHGIFEASAYFIAAIAGAIIGIAATKRHYYKHEMKTILQDAIILIIIALACLTIGAFIEAQIIVAGL
ncbi:MAG TPA: stage II sporulation protein M [archaeon]|nr:stage II sporulation protein M [archaeon]